MGYLLLEQGEVKDSGEGSKDADSSIAEHNTRNRVGANRSISLVGGEEGEKLHPH